MSEVKRYFADVATCLDCAPTESVFDHYLVLGSDYDALAAECERLQREAGNDAIAYRAAIERQNEIRAERDAALAELAALKGGREAFAIECGLSNGDGTYSVHIKRYPLPSYIEPHKDHPVKLLYTAPPAQGSAWVEEGLVRKVVTDALIGMVSGVSGMSPPPNEPPPQFIQAAIDRAVDRITEALAAAPTPGASDEDEQ